MLVLLELFPESRPRLVFFEQKIKDHLGHSQKGETKEPFSKMQINFTKVVEKE